MDKNNTVSQQDTETKQSMLETGFDWLGAAMIAMIVVALVFSMFVRVVNVSGDSMTNTLVNGEKLLLSSICLNPTYGDIVVIRREGDTPLIKRVIGLPGDTIYINDATGKVYRNSVELDEPYVRGGFTPSKGLNTIYVVPEGGIFALGDNRRDSLDSRILRDNLRMCDVVGIITYRVAPFQFLRNGE